MTIVMAEEVIRREPLPALPCSKRVEPTKWLCPPPGRERRELAGHLKDEGPTVLVQRPVV